MALFGDKFNTNKETRQLQNEIKSLEFRKQTILSTFETEIAELSRKKSQEFLAAGVKAYEIWKMNQSNEYDLNEYWSRVDGINAEIQDKEIKRAEMEAKYNEELMLLQASAGVKSGATCPQCGANVSADDVFCEKCGSKVR